MIRDFAKIQRAGDCSDAEKRLIARHACVALNNEIIRRLKDMSDEEILNASTILAELIFYGSGID